MAQSQSRYKTNAPSAYQIELFRRCWCHRTENFGCNAPSCTSSSQRGLRQNIEQFGIGQNTQYGFVEKFHRIVGIAENHWAICMLWLSDHPYCPWFDIQARFSSDRRQKDVNQLKQIDRRAFGQTWLHLYRRYCAWSIHRVRQLQKCSKMAGTIQSECIFYEPIAWHCCFSLHLILLGCIKWHSFNESLLSLQAKWWHKIFIAQTKLKFDFYYFLVVLMLFLPFSVIFIVWRIVESTERWMAEENWRWLQTRWWIWQSWQWHQCSNRTLPVNHPFLYISPPSIFIDLLWSMYEDKNKMKEEKTKPAKKLPTLKLLKWKVKYFMEFYLCSRKIILKSCLLFFSFPAVASKTHTQSHITEWCMVFCFNLYFIDMAIRWDDTVFTTIFAPHLKNVCENAIFAVYVPFGLVCISTSFASRKQTGQNKLKRTDNGIMKEKLIADKNALLSYIFTLSLWMRSKRYIRYASLYFVCVTGYCALAQTTRK